MLNNNKVEPLVSRLHIMLCCGEKKIKSIILNDGITF